ncbi:MAG: alpha/beta fold hydrolase [Bacteroidetes bacterium]|nr:alpha/beta fold hydrolase [Bacteroidota bacterium]
MKLQYKSHGSDPQHLYILHGLLGTADNWHLLARKYAEHFTVITPDLRNHGHSEHTREFNYELMVNDVVELMTELGSENIFIIGHSMGGKVAMQLALQNPDLVSKLVVADMRPQLFERGHDHIFKALFSIPLDKIQTRREAEEMLTAAGITNQGEMLFLLKNLGRDEEGKFMWKPNLDSLWENYEEILMEVYGGVFDKPTLFIKGGLSNYILPQHYDLIGQLFPHWKLETIEHSGHWLHADAPEEFFFKTMNFFRG